jgi:hypothetical protein
MAGDASAINVDAEYNVGDGIDIQFGETLINTAADHNGGYGIFSTGTQNNITQSEANYNAADGIVFTGCCNTVTGTTTSHNGGSGIIMGSAIPGVGQVLYELVIGSEATDNGANGIDIGQASNVGPGVSFNRNVIDNTARKNQGMGIVLVCPSNAVSYSNAVGNTAQNNSGGNLVTTGTGCTVLDNKAP